MKSVQLSAELKTTPKVATRSQNHGTNDTPLTPTTEKTKCTCRNNIENSEKRTYSD